MNPFDCIPRSFVYNEDVGYTATNLMYQLDLQDSPVKFFYSHSDDIESPTSVSEGYNGNGISDININSVMTHSQLMRDWIQKTFPGAP